MSVNYREPQWLLPNEKNLQYPAAGATQGSGLTEDRHSLYSMYFNVDHRIDLGSSINLDVNSTISFWYKTSTNNNGSVVFGESTYAYEYLLQWGSSLNKIYFRIGSVVTDFTGVTEIEDGNWHHYCITRTGANAELFVDGASRSTVTGLPTGTNTLIDTIGSTPSGTHTIDNSYLDEIAFWSRSLSSSEISTLYNNGSPSNPMLLSGKPEAYYPLGEQARKPGTAEWRFPNEVLQGQAIDFDGTDYINLDKSLTNLNVSTSFSISCWVNISTNTNYYHIVGAPTSYAAWNTGFGLYTNGSGIRFWVEQWNGANQYVETASLSNNQWYHILATFNTTNGLKLYVNGGTPTTATGTTIDGLSNEIFIGSTGTNTTYGFNGKLSNIALWNSDQSANKDNIYNYGAPQTSYTVTPTAWYKLDKTSEYAGLNPNWHSALSFNGSSNYVNLGSIDETEGITTMSISGWFKPASSGVAGASGIVAKESRDWYVGWYSSPANSIRFLISDDDGVTNDSLNSLTLGSDAEVLDKWQHFVCTWDASDKLKIYINGILSSEASSTNAVSSLPASTNSVELGRRVTTYFDGQISNLAIYNQVISPEDVKYLYNGGTPQTNISFEPLSWYKLNNTGTGIQDSGSASNNGTNNGATEVTDSVAVDQWNFNNAVQSQTPNWSSALDFDGSNDYIETSGPNITSGGFSFSAWFKTSDTINNQVIWNGIDSTTAKSFVRITGTALRVKIIDGSGGSNNIDNTVTTADGNWHHIAFTTDGLTTTNGVIVYVDGEELAVKGTLSNAGFASTTKNQIGSYAPNTWNFNGSLSNIAFYDSVLTASAISTIYNSGQPETAISSSPVSWYKLDNTTTGIQDSGSASNNGTNNGATEIQTNVWTPRLNGESSTLPSSALTSSDLQFNSAYSSFSLNFDSSSNTYINCGGQSLFNGLTAFSISCWIKTNGTQQDYAAIFSYQSSTSQYVKLAFYPSEKDRIRVVVRPGSSNPNYVKSSAGSIVDGEWVHIVAVGDANNLSNLNVYINGVLDNDVTQGNITTLAQSSDIYIGTDASATTTRDFNGKIDETAVWNRALNQAEITSIYNNGYPKDITALSPVSWWRLGEDAYFDGTNFTVPNQITGSPNGTSANMTATDLVADAPGSYAAGLGSSLALADRVGEAPLSTANSLSFNMTPVNRVSYPAGYVPTQADNVYSMDFDGVNDYIYTPSPSLGITNTWSVSAWVKTADKTSDNGSFRGWFATGGWNTALDFKLAVRSDTGYASVWEGGQQRIVGTSNITDDNWYNVVLTKTASDLTLFVNGIQQATVSNSSTWAFNNIYIGAGGQSTGITTAGMWNGNIDELAVFDYALSAKQVKQDIYNGTTSGKTADLNNISNLTAPVAWYRMGD